MTKRLSHFPTHLQCCQNVSQGFLLSGWHGKGEDNFGEGGSFEVIEIMQFIKRLPRGESGAQWILCRMERHGGELSRGGRSAGCKGNAVGGATSNLGDAVVFDAHHLLWLPVGDGTAVALLPMLIVSPGIDLKEEEEEMGAVSTGKFKDEALN